MTYMFLFGFVNASASLGNCFAALPKGWCKLAQFLHCCCSNEYVQALFCHFIIVNMEYNNSSRSPNMQASHP